MGFASKFARARYFIVICFPLYVVFIMNFVQFEQISSTQIFHS